jgi:predicted CXXCH cytochrome family protein
MSEGRVVCSTCHNQHSQDDPPFDPAARTGGPRHFQRLPNDTGQLCTDCHAARNVTTVGEGSHPVGVAIPAGAYKSPSSVPLDGTLNRVQCQTCHQVHNGPTSDGTLLRTTNVTALCGDCHTLADPATARHLSPAFGVMWPGGQYGSTFPAKTDTAQRGSCAQCHQPHGWPDSANTATKYPTLLVERANQLCTTCHDADGPAQANLQAEFAKASNHPLGLAPGAHSATEPGIVQTRHVECGDCHNPHRAQVRASLPVASAGPRPASGPLAGVRGVNLDNAEVNPANFEYEICLRCHGDSPNKPAPLIPRQFNQANLRLEFDGSYPRFHPVGAVGKNPNVPSLINGWSKTSYMGCTSCHNNSAGPANGGNGPNGAHGSANPYMLERAYSTATFTSYSEAKYALCFKCHSAASILGNQSFHEHDKHVRGGGMPCSNCHDAHASAGNGKLINFDTRIVTPYNGKLEWKSYGTFSGECTLVCHGEPHTGYWY